MGNYYNPVKIIIDRIDVIESVLNNLNPQVKNIVLLTRGGDFSQSQSGQTISKCIEKFEVKKLEVKFPIQILRTYFPFIHKLKTLIINALSELEEAVFLIFRNHYLH